MDTEMTALTAAPAMATAIVEPDNLSRMMVSSCLAVCDRDRIPQTVVNGSVFRHSPIGRS
jgi:hypothetical protein